ncbi:hypothetical protein [Mycolicibacterium doricum]|nr:hypothetical protein [Mycolicibacterium doricum]
MQRPPGSFSPPRGPDDDKTPPPFERAGGFLADETPYVDKVHGV